MLESDPYKKCFKNYIQPKSCHTKKEFCCFLFIFIKKLLIMVFSGHTEQNLLLILLRSLPFQDFLLLLSRVSHILYADVEHGNGEYRRGHFITNFALTNIDGALGCT